MDIVAWRNYLTHISNQDSASERPVIVGTSSYTKAESDKKVSDALLH